MNKSGNYSAKRDAPRYHEIPVIENITASEVKALLKGREYPVIIKNHPSLREWKIFDWDLSKLSESFGDSEVSPRVGFPHPDNTKVSVFSMTSQEYPQKTPMTLKDFLNKAMSHDAINSPIYMQPCSELVKLFNKINEKGDAFNFEDLISKEEIEPKLYENFYIGSTGTRAGFHQDDRDNIILVTEGQKSVHLCSPYYTSCLYPYPNLPEKSQVRPEDFDPHLFPKMAEATFLKGILNEKDMLFIPRGWWHTLRSHKPTIMLNWFYGPRFTKQEVNLMYKSMGLKYRFSKISAFISAFAKASLNLLLRRDTLHGLSVWYSPGTMCAVELHNFIAKIINNLCKSILRTRKICLTPAKVPYYYD